MEINVEIAIDKPAAAVWKVLGEDFADIGAWSSNVVSSSMDTAPAVGAVRTAEIAATGPIKPGDARETLTSFDLAAMSLVYRATEGIPGFIKSAANAWSVHEIDADHSLVKANATMEIGGLMTLLSPLLKMQVKAVGTRYVEELKHYVETGRPHPRKAKAIAKNSA